MLRRLHAFSRPLARSVLRRPCANVTASSETAVSVERPSGAVLRRHFLSCALPMVGFGLMDNTILIRAGEAIDRYFGVDCKMPSIVAAAWGQVVSDFCGVLFGGVVESASRRFLVPAVFTQSQMGLRVVQLTGTLGAAIGVVVGCLLGMVNLLSMDLAEVERLKRFAELQDTFEVVISSAKENVGAKEGSVFLVDDDAQELYSYVATGITETIRVPINEKSISGSAAKHNKAIVVKDAYADPRFNPSVDKKTGRKTVNMLAYPVVSLHDESRVIAVVMLLNKDSGFTDADQSACRMLSKHIAVFMSKCE